MFQQMVRATPNQKDSIKPNQFNSTHIEHKSINRSIDHSSQLKSNQNNTSQVSDFLFRNSNGGENSRTHPPTHPF